MIISCPIRVSFLPFFSHTLRSEKILYISTLLIIFHDAEIDMNYFIFRELTKKMTTTLTRTVPYVTCFFYFIFKFRRLIIESVRLV